MAAIDFGSISGLLADVLGDIPRGERLSAFLFGSALTAAEPRDIDILLVYPDSELDLGHAAAAALRDAPHLPPIEVLAMSETEEAQTSFVVTQRAIRLDAGTSPSVPI